MAKKFILLFAVVLLTLTATIFTLEALQLGVEDEFKPLITDKSFMLDSPLFTHEYESETYAVPTPEELADIKTSISALETDANYVAGPENDRLALYYRRSGGSNQGGAIRVINKETGYIWSSDVYGLDTTTMSREFFQKITSSCKIIFRTFDGSSVQVNSSAFNKLSVTLNGNTLNYVAAYETSRKVEKETVVMKLSFEFSVTLTETGIDIHMPVEKIHEENCQIVEIAFFPYIGAALEDNINGYIAVPSGNGGLIKYSKTSPITFPFATRFYGADLNVPSYNYTKQLFSMPMFGIVHGVDKDGCLVEINSGDEFAAFNYAPPGIDNDDYHTSYLTFELRHPYEVVIGYNDDGTPKTITRVPEEHYETDVNYSYSFVSGEDANYVGLARTYQKHLVDDGKLSKQELAQNASMHVEVFGREYENGLIMKKYHNMTTVSDLLNIDEFLRAGGASDVLYTLKGFYKGGYSASNPSQIKIDSALGNIDKLSELDYYLYYNPVVTMSERLSEPSYILVNVTRRNTYKMIEELAKYHYYSSVKTIVEGASKVMDKYAEKVSFDGVTNYLYGDFNEELDREDTLSLYKGLFGDNAYPMYAPNAYLFKNTSQYLAMDLYHENLKVVTDSVPLTQIVLRGYMDMYSTYLNFSTNPDVDKLKCIEYGVYPAYLITNKPSHLLSKTLSNDLYATEFNRISSTMLAQYEEISGKLNQVIGYQIVDRDVIKLGLVKVTYSDGVNTKAIVVNYTQNSEVVNNKLVDSMSSEVIDNA